MTIAPYPTVRDLLALPEPQRMALLASLPQDVAERIRYDWTFWARPKQLMPEMPFSVWYQKAGRGAGKTRSGAEGIKKWQDEGYGYFALIGQTPGDVRDVMIEGESGILKISPPWNMPLYEPSKRRLTWPNGARATTFSGANPDELRGPQHEKAWMDELAAYLYPRETWDNMNFGLRLGNNPQVILTTTPKPMRLLKEIQEDEHTITVTSTSFENRGHLAPSFFSRIVARYEGTRTGLQELYAMDLDEAEGALWKRAYIQYVKQRLIPDLFRVEVAIDPAVTNKDESDETGIIVGGVANVETEDSQGRGEPKQAVTEKKGYVLADRSGRYSPNGWASEAIRLFVVHNADRIVAEVNNGGDLVENTLRMTKVVVDGVEYSGTTIPFKAVHASRGKATRAEPVVNLYEQGRIFHVEGLADLEDQMCTWVPGEDSPDRMDALVWLFTDLMVTSVEPNVRFIN